MNITKITIREIKMFDGGKAFYRQNHNSNNFPSFRAFRWGGKVSNVFSKF